MTDPAVAAVTARDVVCPFCGLGCDDVALTVDRAAVTAAEGACGRAAALFSRSGAPAPPARIDGRHATLDEAVAAAATLLSKARSIAYGGLGADVNGMRALIRLAARTGGSLDHYASTGLFRNLQTSQRKGWIATTLAEVRNRCDLLLVVGPDPSEAFHRLYERIAPKTGRFVEGRKVVFLGGAPSDEAEVQLADAAVETIAVSEGGLVDALSRLGALVAGTALAGAAKNAAPELGALAEALKAATYPVLAWNAGALGEDGDLVVERCAAIVDTLNVTIRAGCLPLAGRDNLIGAHQTILWTVGFPLRTGFRDGQADHDQSLHAGEAAWPAADVAVWVSAFRPEAPAETGAEMVAVAHPDTVFSREPRVFIPVGQPGLDHEGHVFRTDTVVCLPLRKHRDVGLPSVAEVAKAVLARLAEARS